MHWYPGQGDPFDWPIADFDHAVARIPSIERRKSGEEDTSLGRVLGGFRRFLNRQ